MVKVLGNILERKTYLSLLLIFVLTTVKGYSAFGGGVSPLPNKDSEELVKYRRSSLHTMIVKDMSLPRFDIILNAFMNADFPDKYNNHTIDKKTFSLSEYASESETDKIDEGHLTELISRYFKEHKVANKIVGKWFNRKENGAFDMQLIGDRGLYNASTQDLAVALSTERGRAMLADAGEELIPNTFIVVNHSRFVSNENVAQAAREIALELANEIGQEELKRAAILRANRVYERASRGYSVWTTAYLYQLEWDDSISTIFYENMWIDENNADPFEKRVFDDSDLFRVKFVGYQKASSFITGLGSNAHNDEMIIRNATLKSIDAVYAKLQRKFERFRTKTPLISVDPLGAKIGLKEGLESGDRYEVLEQVQRDNGRIEYKRKGVIKVDKNKIWNNKFIVGEEPVDHQGNSVEVNNNITFTHFKGGKGYYPGMLLRQIN